MKSSYPIQKQNGEGPRSRGGSQSLAVFDKALPGNWLLEGETTSSGELNHVFVNTSPFRVGRHSSNHLTISNRTVSGKHAELILENGGLFLGDLDSTNGTFLNGKRVRTAVPLADGDIIHFGKVRFHVRGERDSMPRATLAFDAEGDALAHLQFASLWEGDGLNPHFQAIVNLAISGRSRLKPWRGACCQAWKAPFICFRSPSSTKRKPSSVHCSAKSAWKRPGRF